MPRRKISVGMAERDSRPHLLYRFYDRTGVLLYIGITVNFEDRQKHHARYKDWWPLVDQDATEVKYFNGRRAALDAEREAIKAARPLHNDHHNEWVKVDDEPECLCGNGDLPAVVHDILDVDERDELFAQLAKLPPGERIYESDPAEFTRLAIEQLIDTRLHLDSAIFGFMRDLPDDLVSECAAVAFDEVVAHMGVDWTDYDVTVNTLRHLGGRIASMLKVAA